MFGSIPEITQQDPTKDEPNQILLYGHNKSATTVQVEEIKEDMEEPESVLSFTRKGAIEQFKAMSAGVVEQLKVHSLH